jgi:hypothetical protein
MVENRSGGTPTPGICTETPSKGKCGVTMRWRIETKSVGVGVRAQVLLVSTFMDFRES